MYPTYNTFESCGGRKKFGTAGRIANELRREIRKGGAWTHLTPTSLLSLFERDASRKCLPVRGSVVTKFDYSLNDVISLLRTFKICARNESIGKKLKDIPFFSKPDYYEATNIEEITKVGNDLDSVTLFEDTFKPQLIDFSMKSTFDRCMIVLLEELLHGYDGISKRLAERLSSYECKRMDPYGVYIFMLHLVIRGTSKVPALQTLYQYQAWNRMDSLSKQQVIDDLFAGNATAETIVLANLAKDFVNVFNGYVKSERKNFRLPSKPFISESDSLASHIAYNIYVRNHLSKSQQYRIQHGLPLYLCGEPTMFSPSSIVSNAIQESAPLLSESLTKGIKDLLASPEVKENLQDVLSKSMESTATGMTEKTQGMFDNIKTTLQPLADQAMSLFTSMNGLTSFVKSMFQQAISLFPSDLIGGLKLNFDVETLFSLFKYYIVYINVDSKPLKIALLYFMLRELGLLNYLLMWGKEIFMLMIGSNKPVVEGSLIGEPTSACDWMSSLVDMISSHGSEISVCTFMTALLYMIFKHVRKMSTNTMRFAEYSTVAGVVTGICRNMHFMGAGLLGIDRVYKYFLVISQSLTLLVRKHILGISENNLSNEKKVAKWLIQLKFFSTDTGRSAIRVSKKMLESAERIMADGLAFIAAQSKDQTFVSRETMMQIHRVWPDVKVLANFTYRLRSASTFKPAMFHIQFTGEPGVGKSTLTENLINDLSKRIYPADKTVSHWSYNPNCEYFDGYSKQTVMIIDDLFRFNEPKHLSLIIGLITNTPVTLPMAHLEDKGMDLDSDILISSTNTPYPIGKDIFCMEAVHRRRHMLVEVTCDSRVKKNGKFSKDLFDKYYPGQNSREFPHLKFSLMKSVISAGEEVYMKTDGDSEKYKERLIKKLMQVNSTLSFGDEFYFSEDARPPANMSVPCVNWSYTNLLANMAACYAATREEERKMTVKEKYEHVMECFAEIDNIFQQSEDFPQGVTADATLKLVSDQILDASFAYGRDDPLGERIYASSGDIIPDVCDLDVDGIVEEFLAQSPSEPTNGLNELQQANEDIMKYFSNGVVSLDCHQLVAGMFDKIRNEIPLSKWTVMELDMLAFCRGERGNPLYPRGEDQIDTSSIRRIQIQRRLQKRQIHPVIANSLHIEKVSGKEVFPIKTKITQWIDELEDGDFSPIPNMEVIELENIRHTFVDTKPIQQNVVDFFNEISSGTKLSYPTANPGLKEAMFDGMFSVEFLRRIEKIDGVWYVNIDDIAFKPRGMLTFEKDIDGEIKKFMVPFDLAYLASTQKAFINNMDMFGMLTHPQQEQIVDLAKWNYIHAAGLSFKSLKMQLSLLTKQVKETIFPRVFDTASWIWNCLGKFCKIFGQLAVFIGFLYITRSVAGLLMGSKTPTSKFLHRNQVKTGIQFRGSTQSGMTNSKNTQEILAQSYLDKNVKFFNFQDVDGISRMAHGIHTKQFLIINAHTARPFLKGVTTLTYTPTINSDQEWEIEVKPEQVYIMPHNDLAIIFSRHLPMAKDITHQFITNDDFDHAESMGEVWTLTNFQNQQSLEIRDRAIPYKKISLTSHAGDTEEISKAIAIEGTTVAGKSGSMLMRPSRLPGHRSIVGIQAWKVRDYYSYQIYYQVVTQEMLQHLISNVEKQVGRPVISQEGPLFCEPTVAEVAGIVSSHLNVEGSVPKDSIVGLVGKTQFRKTAIASIMEKDGFASARVPAALNPMDARLQVKEHPMKHSVNKHGTGKVGSFDLAILERATQDMAYWLRDRLDQSSFNTSLSIQDVVTGVRLPGSNPVDCRKSAGLPHVLDKWPGKPKGKKAYVDIEEDGSCVIVDPEFITRFEAFYEKLRRGEIPKHSSYDFPKDELRPINKALGDPEKGTPPKTRSVTCMSMEMIFAWRRVTLELMASLHRAARGDFPFGPGINPEGPDWTRLFHYLNKHPHAMDFDVSNWDGHLPPELMYAVGDMLCIILRKSYTSPEAKVIYSLLTEVLFGHVQFQDLVYQKCRGLISGFPGTAETNTLVHLLLMYYFYLYTASLTDNTQYATITDFFKFVSPVFYGDDVIMSVSDEIIHWFNGKTIANMYEGHGYPVTSASKDKEMPKRRDLMDCTFLKSGFRYVDASRVDRLMDLSVCYDLMYWVRAKEHPYDQFRSNLFDAFRLIHGHGEQVYEQVRDQVNQWLRKANLEPFDLRWEVFENDKIHKYYS